MARKNISRSKSKAKASNYKSGNNRICIVESDSPNGPWSEIPDKAVKVEKKSLDESRLSNPILNWIVPIDMMTELYDKAMGCNTRLTSQQLGIIKKRFGQNCTLRDIRIELETKNIKFEGKGWPFIVDYSKRLPDDLMTLTVAISRYKTSKVTIRRKIKKGEITSYSLKDNPGIFVSEKEVKRFAPPK